MRSVTEAPEVDPALGVLTKKMPVLDLDVCVSSKVQLASKKHGTGREEFQSGNVPSLLTRESKLSADVWKRSLDASITSKNRKLSWKAMPTTHMPTSHGSVVFGGAFLSLQMILVGLFSLIIASERRSSFLSDRAAAVCAP